MSYKGEGGSEEELAYIKESFELRFPDEDDVGTDYGFLDMNGDTTKGLKRVIDFVDKSSGEFWRKYGEIIISSSNELVAQINGGH